MSSPVREGTTGFVPWLVAGVGLIIGVLLLVHLLGPGDAITETKLRRALAGVPPGSSRATVEAWAASNGLNRSTVYWNKTSMTPVEQDVWKSIAGRAGVALDDVGGILVVAVNRAYLGVLTEGGIDVYFFFDDAGRLVKWHLDVRPHLP